MAIKKVRIALAIDHKGNWGTGGSVGLESEIAMADAIESICLVSEPPITCHWIEAEIPIPEDQTVQGQVTPAKE